MNLLHLPPVRCLKTTRTTTTISCERERSTDLASRLPPPPAAAAAPVATVEQRVRRTQKLTTRCPLGAAVVESISKDSGSSGERPASDLGIIDHRSSAARSKNGFQLRRKTPSHDQIAILKSIRYFLLAARVVIARVYCDSDKFLPLSQRSCLILGLLLYYIYNFFATILIINEYQRRLSFDNFSLFMSSSCAFWVPRAELRDWQRPDPAYGIYIYIQTHLYICISNAN